MLSRRALSFLSQHKRRPYAWDADFLTRIYRQAGFSCAQQLVEFQHAFAGYVSPTNDGQWIWGLSTSTLPKVHDRCGEPVTCCTAGVDDSPLIDGDGRLYLSNADSGPVVSSCSMLFEQMAFVWEWHDQLLCPGEALRPPSYCADVDRFRCEVLPRMERSRIADVSDEYSQVYSNREVAMLVDSNGASAWLRDSADWLRGVFAVSAEINMRREPRFADRVRQLFCGNARSILYW